MKDKLADDHLWTKIFHKIRMEDIEFKREMQSTIKLLSEIELLLIRLQSRSK